MNEVVLTLNAGSSSVKFSVYQADGSASKLMAKGQVEGIGKWLDWQLQKFAAICPVTLTAV